MMETFDCIESGQSNLPNLDGSYCDFFFILCTQVEDPI